MAIPYRFKAVVDLVVDIGQKDDSVLICYGFLLVEFGKQIMQTTPSDQNNDLLY